MTFSLSEKSVESVRDSRPVTEAAVSIGEEYLAYEITLGEAHSRFCQVLIDEGFLYGGPERRDAANMLYLHAADTVGQRSPHGRHGTFYFTQVAVEVVKLVRISDAMFSHAR